MTLLSFECECGKTWQATVDVADVCPKCHKKAKGMCVLTEEEVMFFYKEPVEFDAHGAEYVVKIWMKFNRLSPNQRKIFIKRLEHWLRHGGELPEFAFINPVILAAWKSRPTLWRKFQQKMFSLVQDLKYGPPQYVGINLG